MDIVNYISFQKEKEKINTKYDKFALENKISTKLI